MTPLIRSMMRVGLFLLIITSLGLSTVFAQETVAAGDVIEATADNETVEYALEANEGDVFVISLDSEAFDPLLEVSLDGVFVASDDDSGEGTNSLLNFVAPSTGTFIITVRSFTGDATGAYVLRVSQLTTDPIAIGDEVEVQFDGAEPRIYRLDAEAGAVINISATAPEGTDVDADLRLRNSTGEELIFDGDGGPGPNPYIRRFVVPVTGSYFVEVVPFGDDDASGTVSLSVSTTETLMLSAEPITVEVGIETEYEIAVFEVEPGTVYRVIVERQSGSEIFNFFRVGVLAPDEQFASSSLSISGFTRIAADLTPTTSGTYTVRIDASDFNDEASVFTVSVETVE